MEKHILSIIALLSVCCLFAVGDETWFPGIPPGKLLVWRAGVLLRPENLKPGDYELETRGDTVKIVPRPGSTNVVLELKTPVKVDDSMVWFTMEAARLGSGSSLKAVLVLENRDGKEIQSTSFPHRAGENIWCILNSEWTFRKYGSYQHYYEDERVGLKLKALRLLVSPTTEAVYFKVPILFGGDTFDPDMTATCSNQNNVRYDGMAPVRPERLSGKSLVTFELQKAFQEKPFFSQTKCFDFSGVDRSELAWKTDVGFQPPHLSKGYYSYVLTTRDPDSGGIQKISRGTYCVMSSSLRDVPTELEGNGVGGSVPLTFVPTSPDFVFKTPDVRGTLTLPDLSQNPILKNKGGLRLTVTFGEYNGRWHYSNALKPEVYRKWDEAVAETGGPVVIDIPVDADLVEKNRAFYLTFDLFDAARNRIGTDQYIVGVKGRNNAFVPHPGEKLTWKKVVDGSMLLSTGLASITLPDSDLRSFINKVAYQEAYNTFLGDGCWSKETEPLKGFYTYTYLDKTVEYVRKAGLQLAIQIGGMHNDPEWSVFEREPTRGNDGRFLSAHYNSLSIWADCPAKYIRRHMLETVKRYSGVPNLAYWKCWCYEGEGFTHDWWYMWMYGDVRSGYCEPGIRHYRQFLKAKYQTVEALNRAHGTTYVSFDEVFSPQPVINLRLHDRLRNPRPMFDRAYADFLAMKQADFTEYWEDFVFTKVRAEDPDRMFAPYFYGDAEGDERCSKGVFTRNPGLLKHNGGFSGDNIMNTWSLFFGDYEGLAGMISEDVAVWGDTITNWLEEVHGTTRMGGKFSNFFNYTIYQTRRDDIEMEKYDRAKAEFFRGQSQEYFKIVRKMKRIPSRIAVYLDPTADNFHTHIWPWGDLFFARYQAEPICYKYLDRLAEHYDVLAIDSGVATMPEADIAEIAAWVRNGGTLITTPAIGAWTEEDVEHHPTVMPPDHEPPLAHPNALLDALGLSLPAEGHWATQIRGRFSAKTLARDYFPDLETLDYKNAFSAEKRMVNADRVSDVDGMERTLENGFSVYAFPAKAYSDGRRLAVFDSPEAMQGRPAMLELKVGKGRVLLLSQYPIMNDTGFWYGICDHLGIKRYLSFAGRDDDRDIYLPWTNGYLLKADDGSYLLSTLSMSNRDSYRHTFFPTDEQPPLHRRVRAHHLAPGRYKVWAFRDGQKQFAGTFTSEILDREGISYDYNGWSEVVSFYLEPIAK